MSLPRNVVLVGDVRKRLAELPAESVDCVMTSPPYFQLRNYGRPEQIGLEANVEAWADELRLVMRDVARVLKPGGSLWLNVGDSYSRHTRYGTPPKSLLLGPEPLFFGGCDFPSLLFGLAVSFERLTLETLGEVPDQHPHGIITVFWNRGRAAG